MADARCLALIHAEIDQELDASHRSELARRLLAERDSRALRDEFQRLCALLDAIEQVEPPPQLLARIADALPPSTAPLKDSWWRVPRWRYAAVVAGLLAGAAVLFETVNGPGPLGTELTGTMAAARERATLETVRLVNGPVVGHVDLYRDGSGLGLTFEVAASAPVEVLVESGGRTLRVSDLGRGGGAGGLNTSVALPGFGVGGSRAVDLTFLVSGREVGRATLPFPDSH
jgi:hypothetical protein